MNDWTKDENGNTNSSQKYIQCVNHVEQLLRDSAHTLIAGRADLVARLIVAQLAHVEELGPQI